MNIKTALNMKYLLIILLVPVYLLCASCQEDTPPEPIINPDDNSQTKPDVPSVELRELETSEMQQAMDEFAFKLLTNIYKESEGGNVCVSPLSVQYGIGMLVGGTDGNTRDELMRAIGFDPNVYSSESMGERLSELMSLLRKADAKVTLNLANALFVNPKAVTLKSSYTELTERLYSADIKEVNLDTTSGIDDVNHWIDNLTNGLISSILTYEDRADILLVNALMFRGQWEIPFLDIVQLGWFNNPDGSRTLTRMLYNSSYYCYGADSRFKRLYIPIGSGAKHYRLEVYQPTDDLQLADVINEMTPQRLTNIPDYVSDNKDGYIINLALPKLSEATEYDMENVLCSLGVKDAFNPEKADFLPMTDANGMKLSMVRQKNTLMFTEWGVEAASATAVGSYCTDGGFSPEVINFYLLKPFVYILREVESNCILYIGAVSAVEEYVEQ